MIRFVHRLRGPAVLGAILVLALGLAGLLRQVGVLSRSRLGAGDADGGAGQPTSGSPRSTRDLVGFRLPMDGPLQQLVDGDAERTVVAFVSPGCPSCTQTLQALAADPLLSSGRVGLVAVSTGSCDPAEVATAALAGSGRVRCVPQGRDLLSRLYVPATPYLVVLTPDGTLDAALLPDEDTDVGGWLRHSGAALPTAAPGPRRSTDQRTTR